MASKENLCLFLKTAMQLNQRENDLLSNKLRNVPSEPIASTDKIKSIKIGLTSAN